MMTESPLLTIIVPVYNEEKTIVSVMQSIQMAHPDAEIIYVDDGSKDQSRKLMSKHKRPQDLLLMKENGGKGSAVRMGIQEATGKYTAIQDADLEYDPAEISLLVEEAQKYPGAVIFGSRFLKKNPNLYKRYLLGNKALSFAVNILFGDNLTDAYTCYKLFPTKLLQSLELTARGFELEAELCTRTLKKGIPIKEVPISYHPRSIQEGKKIKFSDAWRGLWMMLKIRIRGTR